MAGAFDIGKVTGRIDLEDYFSGAIDKITYKIDGLDKYLGGFGGRLAETAGGFLTAQAAMGVFNSAVGIAKDQIREIYERGSQLDSVSENFDKLTAAAGRSGETLLGSFREGTRGVVDNLTLLKNANELLTTGLALTDEQFKLLGDAAFALSQATGGSLTENLDKVNDALKTGRTRSVEALTGFIDLDKAEAQLAATKGVLVTRLTDQEKIQARQQAILTGLADATSRLGEQNDGLGETIGRMMVDWQNFNDELGRSIIQSPVINAAFEGIAAGLARAFGTDQQDRVATITRMVEDFAIGTIDAAKFITDAVGTIGFSWNGLKIGLEQVAQGYRVITLAVEELLLLGAKTAEFFGLDIASEWVTSLTSDIDRLYEEMGKAVQRQNEWGQAQTDWAVKSGEVKDALERIKQGMLAAREEQDKAKVSTDELAAAEARAKKEAEEYAAAQDHVGNSVRRTAEEEKKHQAALAELASISKTYKDTIKEIDPLVVKSIKGYMEQGVALDTLAAAYDLTKSQVAAINKEFTKEQEELKKATKAAKEKAEAMAELKAMTEPLGRTLQGVSGVIRDQATKYLALGASTDTVAKAFGITKAQAEALRLELERTGKGAKAAGDALAEGLSSGIDKAREELRKLREDMNKTHTESLALGGQFDVRPLTAAEIKAQGGEKVLKAEVAKFEQLFAQYPGRRPGGSGPTGLSPTDRQGYEQMLRDQIRYLTLKASGFREGGYGDFGSGTLVTLHGKEIITPIDKLGSMGNTINNTFYVNGTGQEIARIVKEEIMRDLRLRQQLPSR